MDPVHKFVRASIMDLDDLPVLGELLSLGLCEPPRFLPGWASDIRFLLRYLSYSSFLNTIDLSAVRQRYRKILESMPKM